MFGKKIGNKGYTMVEIILAIGIFSIIVVSANYLMMQYFRFNDEISVKINLQNEARNISGQMVDELRKANQASNGASVLDSVDSASIIFFSNIDDDSYTERIRYFIDGTNLKKGVTKPSGNPLVYDTANNEAISILSTHVDNGTNPLFVYYDDSYNGSGTPLASPVDKTQVKMVGINLILKDSSLPNPVSLNISMKVNLRNLISK